MNLDAYDDMMGLEFGDYEGLSAIFDPQLLKEALVAASAGGGAILLATFAVKKTAEKIGLESMITDPLLRSAVTSTATFLAGVAGGRALYAHNREAAIGVVGGLGGIAMANLLDAVIAKVTGSARMLPALGEASAVYGPDEGMSALAALEATSVNSAPGAFNGFAGPTVTPEQLMGFEATVTQTETLGEQYNAYMA